MQLSNPKTGLITSAESRTTVSAVFFLEIQSADFRADCKPYIIKIQLQLASVFLLGNTILFYK